MFRFALIQPGSTDFDEQGRIKGCMDLPLSASGLQQASLLAQQLASEPLEAIYSAPNQSALQTAEVIAESRKMRVRRLEKLKNIDHGLWHGKLIDEVRQNQPKIYRQGQESPESFCPPGGEAMSVARQRAQGVLNKLAKKHKKGTVALVVSDPLASVIRGLLHDGELVNVWKSEQDCGVCTLIDVPTGVAPVNS